MPRGGRRNAQNRRPLPQQHQPPGEEVEVQSQRERGEPMEVDDQSQEQSPSEQGSSGDQPMKVDLDLVKIYLQCPICLKPRRQSRMAKDCFHRFCKKCIDKAIQFGNHECPVCRVHIASRRSLVADIRSDNVIACLYPNMSGSEDDDVELNDEERSHNEQIQASFAQALERQMDSLKRHPRPSMSCSRRRLRGSGRRGRQRRIDNTGIEQLNGTVDGRDSGIEPLSSEQLLLLTDSGFGLSEGDADTHDEVVVNREAPGPRQQSIEISDVPSWGKGGHRSQIWRDKDCSSSNDKKGMANLENDLDLLRLKTNNNDEGETEEKSSCGRPHFITGKGKDDVDESEIGEGNDDVDEFEIYRERNGVEMIVALISLDTQILPDLEQPYISCPLTYSVGQLCQHVATKTGVRFEEVELSLVTDPVFDPSESLPKYESSQGYLRKLKSKTELKMLQSMCTHDDMRVLGYKRQFVK